MKKFKFRIALYNESKFLEKGSDEFRMKHLDITCEDVVTAWNEAFQLCFMFPDFSKGYSLLKIEIQLEP